MACFNVWDVAGCGCTAPPPMVCGCAAPATINGTHSTLGAFTLNYDAGLGAWNGTSTYNYPGCNKQGQTCPAHVVTLTWKLFFDGLKCSLNLQWENYLDPATGLPCTGDGTDGTFRVDYPLDHENASILVSCSGYSFTCSPFNLSYTGCNFHTISVYYYLVCGALNESITMTG